MSRRNVLAPCSRTTLRAMRPHHHHMPLFSPPSAAVRLLGLLVLAACFDVAHSSHPQHQHQHQHHHGLCRATPSEQQEYASARYESARPSGGSDLDKFAQEWLRDVREEERARYQPVELLGRGHQGSVVEAKDLGMGKMVAIKQVKNAFGDNPHYLNGHRVLQELVLLRLLNSSDHTISIYHAFLPKDEDKGNFTNVYFVMELMDAKLTTGKWENSRMLKMPAESQKKMMFDVLSGLADMHQAGICHRDIGSRNIMGNIDCSFKVIDLGMAIHTSANELGDPRYVNKTRGPTRAERPPEVMYQTGDHWGPQHDIWMTGCTFLQLLAGKRTVCDNSDWPIKQRIAMSATAVDVLGMPSKNTLSKFGTEAREFFESLRPHQKHEEAPGLAAKYSNRADEELLGLVQKMVVLDPDSRLSAAELLREPVFASLRNHSRSSKDQQRLIADLVSESLEILKGSKDRGTNRDRMYAEILKSYEHPGRR